MRAVPYLRKPLVLRVRPVLFQLERQDGIDVVVRDLQQVIRLPERRSVHPVHHALIVVQVPRLTDVEAQLVDQVLFDGEHGKVVRVNRIQLPKREPTGEGDPVDVHVEERHEDSDDETLPIVVGVSQCLPQGVRLPLDLDDGLVRLHRLLIQHHAVGGGEEVRGISEGGSVRIPEEVLLREPLERSLFHLGDIGRDPVAQILRHGTIPPRAAASGGWSECRPIASNAA